MNKPPALTVAQLSAYLAKCDQDSVVVLVNEHWEDVGLLTEMVHGSDSNGLNSAAVYLKCKPVER